MRYRVGLRSERLGTVYSYVIKTERGIVKEMLVFYDYYNIGDEVWVDGERCQILSKNF